MLLMVAALSGLTTAQNARDSRLLDARKSVEERIKASGAETVGVAVYDADGGRTMLINENAELHAASTMKIPVMMEVFRLADAGKLKLGDRIEVKNRFASIVDQSPYQLNSSEDSAPELYQRIGESLSIRELVEVMITRSSNLATNILIDHVGAAQVTEFMRKLGARTMTVRRGVEDGKAFRAGISNTATALDLMILLRSLIESKPFAREASREMLEVLLRQEFNEALPAGLPADIQIAHKTGSITRIKHDAGIVFPHERRPYVIVVLTRGIDDEAKANALIADISRIVYEALVNPKGKG
jgi:beta-lactamase class A